MASTETSVETTDVLAPSYTPEEDEQIARNLDALLADVHRGAHRDRPLTLDYLCELHARLFDGVRSDAGRHRIPGRGSERLRFGPNTSVHREDVEREVGVALDKARRYVASIEEHPDDPDRDPHAVRVAVWTHAEIVRIHPFEDGNGRTSRALMNAILVRLDLRPVAVEECKQTYCDCLNTYFDTEELGPVLDLILRLMGEQLPEPA